MTADGAAGTPPACRGMAADPRARRPRRESRTADIVPGPGGVMTDEVGVVTGELTLRTEYADGQVTLRGAVQGRRRVVRGDRRQVALADPAGLDAVHGIAVGLLHRPEG